VIAVAAIASDGSRASFSNYGATTVDLGAPGSGIWSAVPYNK
jgi:subtilisin family serine protease